MTFFPLAENFFFTKSNNNLLKIFIFGLCAGASRLTLIHSNQQQRNNFLLSFHHDPKLNCKIDLFSQCNNLSYGDHDRVEFVLFKRYVRENWFYLFFKKKIVNFYPGSENSLKFLNISLSHSNSPLPCLFQLNTSDYFDSSQFNIYSLPQQIILLYILKLIKTVIAENKENKDFCDKFSSICDFICVDQDNILRLTSKHFLSW